MSRLSEKLLFALAPRIGYWYIRLLRATMRIEFRNREALEAARNHGGQYVLTFWHSRFVMMPYCYPDERLVVLHSQHRDAQLLVGIMKRFGLAQAWGSTTRGGAGGVRDILRRIRQGYDVGITPDGPKGPRRRVQPGVVAIARLAGVAIVPVSFSARPFRRLGTWDGTLLPFPFGRGLFLYGEPIVIPREADDAAQAGFVAKLEQSLDQLTDQADAAIGIPPEGPRPEVESS